MLVPVIKCMCHTNIYNHILFRFKIEECNSTVHNCCCIEIQMNKLNIICRSNTHNCVCDITNYDRCLTDTHIWFPYLVPIYYYYTYDWIVLDNITYKIPQVKRYLFNIISI